MTKLVYYCTEGDKDRKVLDVLHDDLLARLTARGRAETTPAAIQGRLELHRTQTAPLLDLYGPLVITVNGLGTPTDVHHRITASLSTLGCTAPTPAPVP